MKNISRQVMVYDVDLLAYRNIRRRKILHNKIRITHYFIYNKDPFLSNAWKIRH